MTNPLVSVVMPSYNHARFLREAIDSVLAQDYAPIELLVMDGGSTDGSVEILRSYGDRLAFVSERDRGQSDAINRGLARARGEILCWLNSDDVLAANTISLVVRAFEADREAGFVYGRGWNVDEQGGNPHDSGVLPFDLWRLIHQRNFIHQPSTFFRRSLLAEAGPIDETLHYTMDWELWIRFSVEKARYVDAYLSSNRTYAANKTQSGQFRRWLEIRRIVRRYTNQRWPPVLTLYLLEALLQAMRASACPRRLEAVLEKPVAAMFTRGMMRERSGRRADGGVQRRFHFTVARRPGRTRVRLVLRRAGGREAAPASPISLRWRSSAGDRGGIVLQAGNDAQAFLLPMGADDSTPFVHFRCEAGTPTDGDAPVAFLEAVEVE